MFSLFIMPKRRTFGHFLASPEDKFFLVKKEDMSSKRKTYGKPMPLGKALSGISHLGAIDRWLATPKRARIAHCSLFRNRRIHTYATK